MDDIISNCLFPRKEMYIAEHTSTGANAVTAAIPKRMRRKMIYDNMHLMEGLEFTTPHQFAQLKAYNGTTDLTYVPYNLRNKFDGANQAVHFFLHDCAFRDAVWCNLELTTYYLSKFDVLLTPDLSLWKDLPTGYYNQQNIFRTRFIGAYWQKCGFSVIATASWGGLDSFEYCFEGLPMNSVIAVSGMGNRKSPSAFNLWCYGLKRLEAAKHPTLILVYGQPVEIPGLNTPVQFIPDFISTRLRKIK